MELANFQSIMVSLHRELNEYNIPSERFAKEILKEDGDFLDQFWQRIRSVDANGEDRLNKLLQSKSNNISVEELMANITSDADLSVSVPDIGKSDLDLLRNIERILAWLAEPMEKKCKFYTPEKHSNAKDCVSSEHSLALKDVIKSEHQSLHENFNATNDASNACLSKPVGLSVETLKQDPYLGKAVISMTQATKQEPANKLGAVQKLVPKSPDKSAPQGQQPTEKPTPASRQTKAVFNNDQKNVLDQFYYMRTKYPTKDDTKLLAAQVNCTEKQINSYFSNRRYKLGLSSNPKPEFELSFGRNSGSKLLSSYQRHVLDQYFTLKSMYPTNDDVSLLAAQVDITDKQVRTFFSNARYKISQAKTGQKVLHGSTATITSGGNDTATNLEGERPDNESVSTEKSPLAAKRRRKSSKRNTSVCDMPSVVFDDSTETSSTNSSSDWSFPASTSDSSFSMLGNLIGNDQLSEIDYNEIKPTVQEIYTENASSNEEKPVHIIAAVNTSSSNNEPFSPISSTAIVSKTETNDSTSPGTKRPLSVEQRRELELFFTKRTHYPSKDDIQMLSKLISIPEKTIKIYFQNRRAKAKKFAETLSIETVPGLSDATDIDGAQSKNMLEQFFTLQSQYPTRKDFEVLVTLTGMPEKTIRIWFQNRRAKAAKQFSLGTSPTAPGVSNKQVQANKKGTNTSQTHPRTRRKSTGQLGLNESPPSSKRESQLRPAEAPQYYELSSVKQETVEMNQQTNVEYSAQYNPPAYVMTSAQNPVAGPVHVNQPVLTSLGIANPTMSNPPLTPDHQQLLTSYFLSQSKWPTRGELVFLNSQLGLSERTILNFLRERGLTGPT